MTTDTETSTTEPTETTETTDDEPDSYTIRCTGCDVDVRATIETTHDGEYMTALACACTQLFPIGHHIPARGGRDAIEDALPRKWEVSEEDSGLATARTSGFPSPVFQL